MVQIGDRAPEFELTADDGSKIRLSDLTGQKVVLFFYPRADTSGCTTEACEFRDHHPQFETEGAVVLGISPDETDALRAFKRKYDLPYHLLADPHHQVAEVYGVWKEKSMYGKKFWGVERTTFLIDEGGRIARIFGKVKPKGHAGAVLAEL
jgi:thioredoxin-dependent peroxiredoxin